MRGWSSTLCAWTQVGYVKTSLVRNMRCLLRTCTLNLTGWEEQRLDTSYRHLVFLLQVNDIRMLMRDTLQ